MQGNQENVRSNIMCTYSRSHAGKEVSATHHMYLLTVMCKINELTCGIRNSRQEMTLWAKCIVSHNWKVINFNSPEHRHEATQQYTLPPIPSILTSRGPRRNAIHMARQRSMSRSISHHLSPRQLPWKWKRNTHRIAIHRCLTMRVLPNCLRPLSSTCWFICSWS